jgi:hypothetical protein
MEWIGIANIGAIDQSVEATNALRRRKECVLIAALVFVKHCPAYECVIRIVASALESGASGGLKNVFLAELAPLCP